MSGLVSFFFFFLLAQRKRLADGTSEPTQLGNNRGNKYSKKSIRWPPTSLEFWNFSIDEFAFHDIPDSIGYILETTGQESLSYIGFSQGTAQAFASLAVHPKLNDQVNVFIALAPAMSPAGLSNGVVDALVKASPQVLFLLFGRRSILSSAAMWESVLYPPLFTKLIDLGLAFLFNWRTQNISTSQKLAAYPHLYSFTSTKSVVHWFQIIRTKSFQMYDDDVHPPSLLAGSSRKYTKVAKYPTRNIKTPIVLVYGGSDSLVDIKAMLRELPPQTVANEIPHYEHLDFLWARDVDVQVFQHVFDALESFTGAEHTREEYERYRLVRESSSLASLSRAAKKRAGPPPRHSDVAESDVSTAVGGAGEDSNRDEAEEEEEEGEEGGEEERASEADEEGEEEEQEEDKEDEEEEEQPLRRPPKKPATARPQRPPAPASSPARPRPRAPPPPSLNVSTTTRLHQQQHQQHQQQQQHQRPPPPQPSRDTLTPQAQMPPSPTAARQPRRGSRASTGSLPDELTVPSLAAAAAAATAAAAAAAKTPASPVRGGSAGPAGGGGGGAAIRGYGKKVSRASASGGDGGGGGGGGEGGGDPDSAPPGAPSPSPSRGGGVGRRRGTGSSQVSIESIRGGRGISLGAGM